MAQPLQMTVRRITLQGGTGHVEFEKDNGLIQGTLLLRMPLAQAAGLLPGDTITLTYTKDQPQ